MGTAALGLPHALGVYRGFADLPEVGMRAEPPNCEATLSTLIASPPTALPSRLWTDAYLAAFAISSGLRLVTFDRSFDRFAGLDCLRLGASAA